MTSPAPHPAPGHGHPPGHGHAPQAPGHTHGHAPNGPLFHLSPRGEAVWEKTKKWSKKVGMTLAAAGILGGAVTAGYTLRGNKQPIRIGKLESVLFSANATDTLIGGAFQNLWDKLADQVDEYGEFEEIDGIDGKPNIKYFVKVDSDGDKKSITFRKTNSYKLTPTELSNGERSIHEAIFSQYGKHDGSITREDIPSGEVATDERHTSRIHNLQDFLKQLKDIKYEK